MTKKFNIVILLLMAGSFILQSCGKRESASDVAGEEIELRYAKNLKIKVIDDFTVVEMRNPWDTMRTLQRLLLLKEGTVRPSGYDDATVIKVPLKRSVVYSSVHNSLVSELGATEAIAGICDREYIVDSKIKALLEEGKVADCGSSMSPNVEKIIGLSPDAVLLSPYENGGGEAKLQRFGLPIVECADYMEPSPLGRAEWVKFYGRLYDRGSEADSIFAETEREYLELSKMANETATKPKVLLDKVYGQAWSVPGRKSTTGILIRDAGGINPFESHDVAGSVQLSPEKVMYEAGDADLWLIRYAKHPLTMKTLKDEKSIYGEFEAFKKGNVYGSETISSNIFDDMAFHPHWVLNDMIRIFHPELKLKEGKRYFEKLEEGKLICR